jgi:hypothetical protein
MAWNSAQAQGLYIYLYTVNSLTHVLHAGGCNIAKPPHFSLDSEALRNANSEIRQLKSFLKTALSPL